MNTKVYANKGWQHVGKMPAAGHLYADGWWCFNVKERAARTCNSKGYCNEGNSRLNISKGDQRYPYSGEDAVIGQVIFRVGENGMPEALGLRGRFSGGEDVWVRINDNDDGLGDNDGYLELRLATDDESAAYNERYTKNSYGDPIGTQYKRQEDGTYVKRA